MATLAPSLANNIATARPMPESPPVMSATLPFNFPAAWYAFNSATGLGVISASIPGCLLCV